MNSSHEQDDLLNITPGFQEKCIIRQDHDCSDENENEGEDEMVGIINMNENKLEQYENYRNEFVYKLLVQLEHF